ncbi:hypothetical protein [Bacillus changyiensis]|nr:hypothetical protein [Bacillus changyiensis]MDA1476251.1 hypothetical protein [Bacillus changyiensis]
MYVNESKVLFVIAKNVYDLLKISAPQKPQIALRSFPETNLQMKYM